MLTSLCPRSDGNAAQDAKEAIIELFRKEVNEYAEGIPANRPPCPSTVHQSEVCDCRQTLLRNFGDHKCAVDAPCIVRVVFFPNGTFS